MSFSPASVSFQPRSRYAAETPAQRIAHREIAWRYRRPSRPFVLIIHLRKREITMLVTARHFELPDNAEGRRLLRIMADHLAQLGEEHVRYWAEEHAPWMRGAELDRLIARVGSGKRWTATALGKALQLTNEERIELHIKTIRPFDRTKAQLDQERRQRRAERERKRRAQAGAKPRTMSQAQQKPWLALGISESTYRRRKRRDRNSWPIHFVSQ